MVLFLRCAFILALLGTTALGQKILDVKEGKKVQLWIQPRGPGLPRSGGSCNHTEAQGCNETGGGCRGGVVAECPGNHSGVPGSEPLTDSKSRSNPKSPESNDEEGGDDDDDDDEEEEEADQEEGSDESRENSCETPKKKGKCGPGSGTNISNEGRKSKEKSRSKEKSQETDLLKGVPPPTAPAVESEELENGVPRENQNGNQQGQSESNDGKSHAQATPPTNEVSKAPEGHVGTPATPESSGSSEGKDGAKGENEIPLSTEQKHGSVTNEESAKSGARESEVTDGSSEKGEDPKEEREAVDGQHGIASHPNKDKRGESAAAETSNIPFREKTSVALLLAALSRFYA
ncbi:hypothetical protein ERJ75_000123900 [Trypanosoma vivax]|nr:hypothetical protein ERJ75_000123900 [Trypanosoma vivax]